MLDRRALQVRPISDKLKHTSSDDLAACLSGITGQGQDAHEIVEDYEQALASWFNVPHALAVSSGGAALTVAYSALDVQPGDEVVLPPTCPLCTIYPIMQLGAVPVFCDTRTDNFGLDLDDLARVITARTKAIVEVPMWGYPTHLVELSAYAKSRGIPLILDLAHSHGSTLGGQSLAHYGDISCFSTHDRKPLSTGEGGFMLFRDDAVYRRARSFSRFGDLDGRTFGINHKLSPVQASLGRSRLRKLANQVEARRANAAIVRSGLERTDFEEFATPAGGQTNYYFMLVQLGRQRAKSVIDFLDTHGVPSDIKRYGCKALYEFPLCAPYRRACPQAENLLASITTLPVHPDLRREDLDHMIDVLAAYRE